MAFKAGDKVIIQDIRKVMYGDEFFTEGKPLRVMAIDRDGDMRLEADAYDGMGRAIEVDGVATFLVTDDEFHALTLVEEEL